MKRVMFALMVVMSGWGLQAFAEEIVEVRNKFCPISHEEVGSGGMTPYRVVHNGKAYFLCCAMCKGDFTKDADAYAKMLDEQVAKETHK